LRVFEGILAATVTGSCGRPPKIVSGLLRRESNLVDLRIAPGLGLATRGALVEADTRLANA